MDASFPSESVSPLLLSTHDARGGAARAALRLHDGLRRLGTDASMAVQDKRSNRTSVHGPRSTASREWAKLRRRIEHLPLRLYPEREDVPFHTQWVPDRLEATVRSFDPDIVHLHWVCEGFLQVETLASFDRPIVWTLHDMWAMTGGCHYSGSCNRYKKRCGSCPKLGSDMQADLSRLTWFRKRRAWKGVNLTIVTPSQWLAECARSSTLLGDFPIEVIPYGIDLDVYKPIPQAEARRILNLPPELPIVLFGAMNPTQNPRKGFDLLLNALDSLKELEALEKDPELAVFGNSSAEGGPASAFRTHYLGRFSDDEALALLYSAVNVFVAPSREDNLPLSVQESLACGTPVAAFNIGGMPDMIDHQSNGYLADPYDSQDLATGIQWCLRSDRQGELSQTARATACDRFPLEENAEAYLELYRHITSR